MSDGGASSAAERCRMRHAKRRTGFGLPIVCLRFTVLSLDEALS